LTRTVQPSSSTWDARQQKTQYPTQLNEIDRSARNVLLTGDQPQKIDDVHSIIVDSPRREHSGMPDEVIPLIENLFKGRYLEVFACTKRLGWTTYGNQTDVF
jgi:N6-adenosine-specific RNA methylase IME4